MDILLMKRQYVVTHTVSQTEISTLLDSWFKNTPSVEMLFLQKNIASLCILILKKSCPHVELLRICQGFSLSCKIVYPFVRTSCCFVSDMMLMSRMAFLTCIYCIWSLFWTYPQCNRGIILLTISIILKVQVLWHVARCNGFTNHLATNFCVVMPDICESSILK